MRYDTEIFGYVVVIGPETNPNYFTGAGYSVHLNFAKVFLTQHGALIAARYWQNSDDNLNPLPKGFWSTRRVEQVGLALVE